MKNMLVKVDGTLGKGVTAKDVVLAVIGKIGTAGGNGCAIEFGGEVIRALSMEGRLTICNMAIEAGARAGMVAFDEVTRAYVEGRTFAPKGKEWDEAVAQWQDLHSDEGAEFDVVVELRGEDIQPQVTWGTSPEMVVPVTANVPDPTQEQDEVKRRDMERALEYMDLKAGQSIGDIALDRVFIGSCTNSRIEDIRAAAAVVKGRQKAASVKQVLIVPGSGAVKKQAEAEGLDKVFVDECRQTGRGRALRVDV